MTRRRFIRRIYAGLVSTAFSGLLGSCAAGAGEDANLATGKGMPYVPLNGESLREMAEQKLHHLPGRFLNPFTNVPKGDFGRVLRWRFFSKNHFKQYYDDEPVRPVQVDWQKVRERQGLSITFLKHASVLIQDAGSRLLVDPIFWKIFWFIRDFAPIGFDMTEMPRPDHILITHGHYDHLDKDSLSIFDRNTHVVSPLGYDDIFRDLGMNNRSPLDWFDAYRDGGMEITFLPCNHWTMRNPITGPNTGLWGSYLIKTKSGANIFLSGDAGYLDGYAQIGEMFDIDLAIFNLGAYEPRWFMASSHMNPEETVRAFRELKARRMMVVHWGAFRLGDEPVHFPARDIRLAMGRAGLSDRLIEWRHGDTVSLD